MDVSCGGKTIPRWRTAAILKIDISPYLSEKSSDFHEILYTAADFELDECHVITNEKVALADSEFDRTYFLFDHNFVIVYMLCCKVAFCYSFRLFVKFVCLSVCLSTVNCRDETYRN